MHPLLLTALLGATDPASATPSEPTRQTPAIQLVISGDTFGFSGRSEVAGGFARRKAALDDLRQGGGKPVLCDTGNSLGPLYYARFDRGAFSSRLLADLGYDAINIGVHELDYGVAHLRDLARQHDLPLLSTNLVNADGTHAFPSHRIVVREGIRVGFLGLIDPEARRKVLLGRLDPLEVQPWEEALEATLAQLRGQTDLLVLLSDAPHAVTRLAARRFVELDVVVGPGLDPNENPFDHDDASPFQVLSLRGPDRNPGGTLLTTTRRYGHGLTVVNARADNGGQWRIEAHEQPLPVEAPEDPELAMQLTLNASAIKEALGEVIVGDVAAAFGGEITGDRLLESLLLALQQRAGVGVAALNRAALSNLAYSATELNRRNQLLAYDLERLIWADNHLVVVTVSGQQLRRALLDGDELYFLGAERRPEGQFVRGRPIRDAELYNIATSDFVVSQDGPVDALRHGTFWTAHMSPDSEEPLLLRDVVASVLRREVPPSPHPYPPEWRIHFDDWRAELSRLSTTRLGDASGVRDARVQAVDLEALRGAGRFAVTLDSEDWVWTTEASGRFLRIEIGGGAPNNPEDQLRAGTELIARGFAWRGFNPLASAAYETEFTAPQGLRRLQRLRGLIGIQSDLGGWMRDLRVGPAIEADLSESKANLAAGGYASLHLDRPLVGRFAATARAEARYLPYYQAERLDSVRWMTELELGLKVPVYGNFFLTPRFALFGYQLAGRAVSGNNLTFGVGLAYDRIYKPQTQSLFGGG